MSHITDRFFNSRLGTAPIPNISGFTGNSGLTHATVIKPFVRSHIREHRETSRAVTNEFGVLQPCERMARRACTSSQPVVFPNHPILTTRPILSPPQSWPARPTSLAFRTLPLVPLSRGSRRSDVVPTNSGQLLPLAKFPSTCNNLPLSPLRLTAFLRDHFHDDCTCSRHPCLLNKRLFYRSCPWPSVVTYTRTIVYRNLMDRRELLNLP